MIQAQNLGNLGGKKGFFPWGWSRNRPFSHFQREKTGKDPGWEMKYWIIPDFPSILFPFYIHLFQRLSSGNGGLGFFHKEQLEKVAPSCSRWENWNNSSLGGHCWDPIPGILQIWALGPSWICLWNSHPNSCIPKDSGVWGTSGSASIPEKPARIPKAGIKHLPMTFPNLNGKFKGIPAGNSSSAGALMAAHGASVP